ncbi:MAG TPA: nucleotidyltransferase domain-containing protein [Gammaproteobacteria bacterium]|nr:nucleotidyltransferase domain-containing protein [Gammaproteobacteria bacterium]
MDTGTVEREARLALESADAPVVCAYLFGSYATFRATRDSDVDVAVLLDGTAAGSIDALSRLRGVLERALGLEVDLVDMRTAPPDLVHRILRDGRILVDRDPRQRIAFEVQARNEYFDLLPYLREYRAGQTS